MSCAYHAEAQNVAYCIRCGRALCSECIRNVRGSIYCEGCLAEMVSASSGTETEFRNTGIRSPSPNSDTVVGTSPGFAFALGLLPGVGAIYNGEFLKAAIHVLIFGSLITLEDQMGGAGDALFGLMIFAFYMYMPFEAYYTAKKRKLHAQGIELETPIDRLQQQFSRIKERELWGGVALVAIGGVLLLGNLNLLSLSWIGTLLWPAVLVGLGFWLLKKHQSKAA